jgi:nitrite reductase/ring-hydroxylating ferredoxin subunit
MSFARAARLSEVRDRGRTLFRHDGRQIALFSVGDAIHAVDNRCPHEGYPLLQGSVDAERGLLTCQWHNWKFLLPTGDCVLGEDHVRSYPTRIEDGWVEIDLSDPPVEKVEAEILRGLEGAIDERQYGRIAREIARLLVHGLDPLAAVRTAVDRTYDRFEQGTTHAYAALADWLRLYLEAEDVESKVICLTEAIDHIAHDALRHPSYPFAGEVLPFDDTLFLRAIDAEDEASAVSMMRGAAADGRDLDELELVLGRAAFAHYNDFGHAAIYVLKASELLERLPRVDPLHVLLPVTRSLCFATREDLLPDFRPYAELTNEGPVLSGKNRSWIEGSALSGLNVKEALSWTRDHVASHAPEVVHSALLEAGAVNLLRFDETLARAAKSSVSQGVGWLDFTHAITFGNAVRRLADRNPELWPKGLLQMACFVGRNKRFLRAAEEDVREGIDRKTSLARARKKVMDHGLSEPIFSAHLLKTMVAVEDEIPHVSPTCAGWLVEALDRFFEAPIKEKHPLRTARQALALVSHR